jgi:hypothetical protein
LNFPDYVYRLKKALYGLKQAPSVWYERLTNYLFRRGYKREGVDKMMFVKKLKTDFIVV